MRALALLPIVGLIATEVVPAAEPPAPRPLAWPAGPMEVRVAFPRPIDPAAVEGLAGRTIPFRGPRRKIEDTRNLPERPMGSIRIAAARLEDGGRTLVLFTDPHPREAIYTLTLPGIREAGAADPARTVSLEYDLAGVEASWDDGTEGAKPAWSGWWPGLDPEAVRALAAVSVEHGRAVALLGKPGRLALRTAVALPKGKATVVLAASGPIVEASLAGEAAEGVGKERVALETESTGDAVELDATVRTGGGGPLVLRASTRLDGDPVERPLWPEAPTVPWAPPTPATTLPPAPPFELAGGDRGRGEAVFYGEEAKCATCHRVRGKGGEIGPDLSDLAGREPATVYRDIAEPSAVIHPDYVPYTVALKDGRVAVGVVRAEGADALRVLDTNAQATVVKRSEVEELRPGTTSIMPVGLAGALGEARMRDLIAFLAAPGRP